MSEDNLNIIVSIAEIILCASLTILSVYLFISVKKFLFSVTQIENELAEISDQLSPVISDVKLITDDIKEIVDRSLVQFDKIENVSESLVQKGIGLLNTINKVKNLSNGFMFNTSNLLFAVSKGVKTFSNKLKNGSEKQIHSVS